MKRMHFILAALLMTTGILYAQGGPPTGQNPQKQDRIRQQDCLVYQDGNLYQYRNGERMQVKQQLRLKNGTLCNPDGTCQLKDRKQLRLRDGSCLDMSGNMYKNQNKFSQGKMMSQRTYNHMYAHNAKMMQSRSTAAGGPKGRGGR
jgi:hypothetical protein